MDVYSTYTGFPVGGVLGPTEFPMHSVLLLRVWDG